MTHQQANQSPAEVDGLPQLPEFVAEAKRIVRRVSDASYTQGIDERHDSPARDQRNDDKVRALLGEAGAAIDRLAALASQAQPKGIAAGHKLSPLEPTPQMRKAAADAWLDCDSKLLLNKAAAALRAGIAAAPTEES